ncbi:MAG: LegC family aminotransferase [Alphaproteobacteria bacterium]|nr:LegC family aminotransferase [Rhizobiaceae bacterium]MBU3962034.1 LegC family aminotransferase [Alphaproteobacteria bacterium]MBU4048103.1 LegC family aminotransferase [Alphaproteobacteria bacterium]MBU4091405.1 LegC family aminotransferase [Alphaproteobacteria bacterium]MBU4159038.1 LegC family aminotransferase [Alphaproteobacteria bacterium]
MANLDIARAVQILRETAAPDGQSVVLHEPRFAGAEWEYVKDCLDTGWVSSVGAYVDRFEKELAEAFGVRRAIAAVNGTAALHIALMLAGVKPGDEVLIPALTFAATANAVAYCGAIPHFVDSTMETLGLDPDALDAWLSEIADKGPDGPVNRRTGRRLAAVVPMHAFGHPMAIDRLLEVCEKWGIPVVEDAAESLGTLSNGRPLGGRGLVGITSFNGNKIITTGGGGAILTNDEELGARAKYLTTTAKRPHRWAFWHDELGYNYRLPNLNAALGCAQLQQLPTFLAAKRRLAERYKQAFDGVEGLRFFAEPEGAKSNYWLNAVILDDAAQRDDFLAATNDAGLMTRPCWALMCDLPMYGTSPSMPLPVARAIEQRLVNIPSSAILALEPAE